ncbi:MAG: type VII secretion protein EssC, partial [Clostridia bacterium]|nr:type VII secretion protein EssC [Clostridia bacterium]
MNTVISVYTAKAYKEFVLPNINNSNYSVILEKDIYSLSKDIVINFDIIENVWRILSGKAYSIKKDSDYIDFAEVKNGLNIEIVTDDGTVLCVSAFEGEQNVLHSKKFVIRKNSISIGSAGDNDIICKNSFVSAHHAKIVTGKDGWYIEDLSQNGVFLNSVRIRVRALVKYGDFINIIGLKIVFLDNMLALSEGSTENIKINPQALSKDLPVQKQVGKSDCSEFKKEYFNRAPRVLRNLHTETLEIEAPPAPKENTQKSLFMTIGPSFTMMIPMLLGCILMLYSSNNSGQQASPMMFTGLITAVASGALGAFWAILNYKNSNSQTYKEEKHRFEAYSDYLMRSAEKIKVLNTLNAEIMNEIYPSATECVNYDINNSKLWNRNESHTDFLSHRIGLGNIPFQAEIQIPKEKFTLVDDSLAEKPKLIKDTYSTLKDVPICLDIKKNKLIGIVGGPGKSGAYEIMKTISAQIATSNCYTDVKLCYIFKEGCLRKSVSFAKWLPHTWSEDKKTRFCAFSAEDASDVCYELTKVFRFRDETVKESNGKILNKPHYVIFVEDLSLLEGEPLAKYIFDTKADYGLSVILFAKNYESLPNSCECIVYNDKRFTGVYTPTTLSALGNKVTYDQISDEELEKMARRLSGIEVAEVETGGEIPVSLTFLEMYGVDKVELLNVVERWKKNRTYENMRALIGHKAGGTECYLDIHEKYHGPHGLVAGTTGSGKSETLQTYILSLALNYSPDDIGFLIVDFKGGGMANLFTDLPHTIGQISNLSGAQVRRAMISIKSENLRRQRILSEHGVNNINAYTKLLKNEEATVPMPHLFIIIDEFAELKREEPEFMSELISVAQVGRSLGVHLILATQKPGGTVDDNIRSNSKFKLCLRVQDKQDSSEMLGRPEAAYLSQAGRCYFQVGNDEIFELFQSGWSGAVYDAASGGKNNQVKLISDTGKTTLSGNKTALKRKEISRRNWLVSFAECVFAVSKESGINLSEAVFKTEKMNELLNNLFVMLDQMDMAFLRNRYNETAAKNLIELLGEFEGENAESVIESALKENVILPEPKELTQLDAVIEHVKDIANKYGYKKQAGLWLPMLPENLYLDTIDEFSKQRYMNGCWKAQTEWSLIAPVGMCDDPENQAQMPLCVDFSSGGHLAVCGNVTSGKSTFLQTLLYSLINLYSPEQLNVYAIDFSSHLLQA